MAEKMQLEKKMDTFSNFEDWCMLGEGWRDREHTYAIKIWISKNYNKLTCI